jgi:hypothetical protein
LMRPLVRAKPVIEWTGRERAGTDGLTGAG